MPLNPHVKRLLDMVVAAGVPDVSRLTPTEMRQAVIGLSQMLDVKDVPVGAIENREIPGPAGPIAVRIYSPVDLGGPLPGLIYFHGGGFVFGSIDTHEGFCRMLANGSKARVISVDYRLAPEHRFPAAVEDSYAATSWIAEHAQELNIDPDRLGIGGDSAGGNLTAVVCQMAVQSGKPKLALQVLFCPAMDTCIETPSRKSYADGYFLTDATLNWTFDHYRPTNLDFNDPRIFPLRATSFSGIPPAQIHTAEFDPLRDEGRIYADRLQQAGVPVVYICHPGMIHHFYCMAGAIPAARAVINAASEAIQKALA